MKPNPKVSVVTTVYNTNPAYLREAIESVLNQTFADFEFIIVNDGSTDSAVAETIRSYHDERIVYIEKANTGIADSANVGIAHAGGEYIARLDSDDISHPNRLAVQVQYLDAHPAVSLAGSWVRIFPEESVMKFPETVGILDVFIGNHFCHSAVMFRRLDFERAGLKYDLTFECAQDYDLWTRAVLKLNLRNIPEVLVDYRDHPNNISHTRFAKQMAADERAKRTMLGELLKVYSPGDFFETLYDLGACNGSHFQREIRLFGFLPIATVVYSKGRMTVKLFSVLPILVLRDHSLG